MTVIELLSIAKAVLRPGPVPAAQPVVSGEEIHDLDQRVTHLEEELASLHVSAPVPGALTQAAARAHGLRTFLMGLITAGLSAVVPVISQIHGADLLTKEGWAATGTLLAGAVISGVVSYLTRLMTTPRYEQALLDAPPGGTA